MTVRLGVGVKQRCRGQTGGLRAGAGDQLDSNYMGHLGGSAVERLSLAQGMIPEPADRVPHWAPRMETASPSACVSASLCVSLMNK